MFEIKKEKEKKQLKVVEEIEKSVSRKKNKLKLKPLGMRTIKTGMAVILTLLLGQTHLIYNPIYAVIGTILGIQNTVTESFSMGLARSLGTILGGFLGFLFLMLVIPNNPFTVGLMVVLVIYICHCLNLHSSISIAITVCVSILLGTNHDNPLLYSFFRTTDTLIGVIIGMLVNYFIVQPKPSKDLVKETNEFVDLSKELLVHFVETTEISLKDLKTKLFALDDCLEKTIADKRLEGTNSHLPQLRELVENCHDYYFHLKCIKCLSEEKRTLTSEEFMLLYYARLSGETLILNSSIELLFDYHFKKIIKTEQELSKLLDYRFSDYL